MSSVKMNDSGASSQPHPLPSQDSPGSAPSPLFASHPSPRATQLLKNPPRIRSSTVAPDRSGAKYYQPPVVHSAMLKEASALDKQSEGHPAKLRPDKVVTEVMSKMTLQPVATSEPMHESLSVASQQQDAVNASIDDLLKKDLDVRQTWYLSSHSFTCGCRLGSSFSWII